MALVVAGLFLAALGRAFASAWGASHRPMEILSAVAIARSVAAGEAAETGRIGAFTFERRSFAVSIETRPDDLAPAVRPQAGPDAGAAGNQPGLPAPPKLRLRRLMVTVATPSRRQVNFATLHLDRAAP